MRSDERSKQTKPKALKADSQLPSVNEAIELRFTVMTFSENVPVTVT